MYDPDIITLRRFYATQFGESVRNLIARCILRIWPEEKDKSMVGFGYATPYLSPYMEHSTSLTACMPARQGAAYWPNGKDNKVIISHEHILPFASESIDRILLIHAIENSEQLSAMIEELWRVLSINGKILIVIPNRRSLWSRSSSSPFGYGRPFTKAQMCELLSQNQFNVTKVKSALFMPPTKINILWKAATRMEKIGDFICRFFGDFLEGILGGIILVEAEKQLYAPTCQPVVEAKKYRTAINNPKPAMTVKKDIGK
ncbi:MAG: methyltransferase domain-containing protein [Rickettsiales bacterium]